MSNASDFVIKDGVLKKYSGTESEVIIPNGVTIIGFEAFKRCNSLEKVVIPDGVTKIRSNAFSECGGLTEVTIPKSVSTIGQLAFYHCKSLTNLTIDFGVKKIEPWAFCGCSSLTSISIPDSVTSIGEWAFGNCNIAKVTMSESVFELFWKSFDKNSGEMPDLAYCFMKDGVVYKRTSEYIRRNRVKLLDAIIKNDDAEAMAGYLSIFNKLTVGDIDEYLKKAEDTTSVKAVLLEYEKKRFTGADKDSFYEDQTSKELGVKEHTLAEWKKIFKIDFSRSEGAYITGYKGNDTVVMIPAKVGNNPVYGIAFKHSKIMMRLQTLSLKTESGQWKTPRFFSVQSWRASLFPKA